MEDGSPKTEWYLARDGHQHGPLSDAELRKFVELGHMRDSDLVWRAGFDQWRPILEVFPPRRPEILAASASPTGATEEIARVRPRKRGGPQPAAHRLDEGEPDDEFDYGLESRSRAGRSGNRGAGDAEDDDAPKGRTAVRAVAALLVVIAIAAGAFLAWDNREKFGPIAGLVATASNNSSDAALRITPFVVSGTSPSEIESSLQRSAIWQIVKREFPDWYAGHTKQLAAIAADNSDERVIARTLAEGLVALRREQAKSALGAPLPSLRKIAETFLDNLAELSKIGAPQCFGFISYGEGTPMVVDLSRTPAHAAHLQKQMVAVLEAAVEGRRAQFDHPTARRADYDMLSWELAKRNWSREDLLTFSDPRRLAALPPEGVCKMVQDWFSAQLDVRDDDVQLRLLAHSLKPLIEG